MILVAGGDSFVWGSELTDSGINRYSCNTYSALLAKQAGMEYVCAAYPGNANNAISRMAIDAICRNTNVFLVVTWTYPQRTEFQFSNGWESVNSWHTTQKEFSQQFFKHVGDNEYYELYTTLKEIVYLQNFCLVRNIPYMFTTADNTFYSHENYARSKDHSLVNLYNSIDWDKWGWFPVRGNKVASPKGFYQWAAENKYNMGPLGHPLEAAHYDASNLIKDKFNELVKEFIQ
jgi:hypothetical protein